jgi:hypothetical protein
MAKAKPPGEKDAILIRLPSQIADKLRELALKSETDNGGSMTANQYCSAILTQAVEAGAVVTERKIYDISPPSTSYLKVADGDPD